MGILINTKLACDCQKSLKEQTPMVKNVQKTSENRIECIYQCPYCNRSIKVVIRMTYCDLYRGVRNE
jgi:hypothetical protein